MKAEGTESGSLFRPWRTLLAVWLCLAVITPLSQFLTILALNASVETDTPVGWAVGLLISMVLAAVVVRTLARRRLFGHANMALVYMLLALAVPLMNIGLVRQFMLATHMVLREYLYEGTSTYRTAYNSLNDRWFPVVPTRDGMAWSRAGRVLQLLEDPQARLRQAAAARQFEAFAALAAEPGADRGHLAGLAPRLRAAIPDLALDNAAMILSRADRGLLAALGLMEPLESHLAERASRSAAARQLLGREITAADEWPLAFLPMNLDAVGYSGRERLGAGLEDLTQRERDGLLAREKQLEEREPALRAAVLALGEGDRGQLLAQLRDAESARLAALGRSAFNLERALYVYRLSRDERRSIINMDGLNGPNQNLYAFMFGLWNTPQEKAAMESMAWHARILTVLQAIPWGVYAKPLFFWGLLFLSVFLFLMCLAEVLRRKWVSRENLPFPLVEVADYLIRHDFRLEAAGDLANPERRTRMFEPLFLIGIALGFVLLLVQGLGHYGFISGSGVIHFDFTRNIFEVAGGGLKNLPETVFVLSPIVIGIVFLLSLEVGFSIWFSYVLYAIVIFTIQAAAQSSGQPLTDANWTGFGNGKLYPFPMEQLLGAALCFALYHLWKARGSGRGPAADVQPYLPPAATRLGLVVLPAAILAMLWDIGVTNMPILLIFSAAVLAITVAAARVRAETGFPAGQPIYEFTKLPIILGMTGSMGAKAYAAFMNIVFLPTALLFRTLPQQLENMELARRYRIGFRTVAFAGAATVVFTLATGLFSFLVFSFYVGDTFCSSSALNPQAGAGAPGPLGIATYPLWVGHFLGEPGLDNFTRVNWYRMAAITAGFSAVGVLLFLRQRFMRFPLHPVGYLVFLMTIHWAWEEPYVSNQSKIPLLSSTIWGSALVAWGIKRMVVKYGGMNVYKRAKPLFVGLIVGSVGAVFLWNMVDLGLSLAVSAGVTPGDFLRRFTETAPFIPIYH